MGHHHRKNRIKEQPQVEQSQNTTSNTFGNMDLSSMLGNLNLNDIDLSKIDMDKVQSIMNNIKNTDNSQEGNRADSITGNDPRINMLNSLKSILPGDRGKTLDSITKFLQFGQLINKRRSKKH
jgi:hypothetical protein